MANILASSIRNKPHLAAFDTMMEQRFSDVDFSFVITNLIDNVSAVALPYLANQFDVTGYNGLRFTTTEQQKRDLIKKAVELHKYKGTPWSIKEALKLIGILDATIIEGAYTYYYNGQQYYNGSFSYGNSSWATFSVLINSASFPVLTSSIAQDMISLILEYKAERSRLIDVGFTVNEIETVNPTEEYELGINFPGDDIGIGFYFDGTNNYDGSHLYGVLQDSLTIDIYNGVTHTIITI